MSSLTAPRPPDALRPTADAALAAWAGRVRDEHEQVDRCRELADPADFYAPIADRFRHDPRRSDDAVLNVLLPMVRPTDRWLDIGSGAGRYALPIALTAREVVAVDPSEAMLQALHAQMDASGITRVRSVPGRWPLAGYGASTDVALMAHVGYDIEALGPFLDAAEAAATRLCVAVMGEGAMTTVATLLWEPVHGEPRVPLPALPELLTVLLARGRLPELRLAERPPATFDSVEDLLWVARRQLWLRPGSARDQRLEVLVRESAEERHGLWALDWTSSPVGIVSWQPDR